MITRCSDTFYSSAANLIAPGRARTTGDGWENARRDDGHDWVRFHLALPGRVRYAELDTSCCVGNARLGELVRRRRRLRPGERPGPGR